MVDLTNAISTRRREMTNDFLVEIRFLDNVLGTQPKSPDLIRNWLEGKLRKEADQAEKDGKVVPTAQQREEMVQKHIDQVAHASADDIVEEGVDRAHTTFFHDETGPWIGDYQLSACFRDIMTTTGMTVAKRGSKQTKQHLFAIRACDEEGTIIDPEGPICQRLHFERDGDRLDSVDGFIEKTAHVVTAQGRRSVLKNHDYVESARLRFLIQVPANMPRCRSTALLRDKDIVQILSHAGNNGLGACRSQQHGKFFVEKCVRITDNPWVDPKSK